MNKRELEIQIELQKLRIKELKTRNDIFKPIRDYTGRYVVFIGGSGSGKSYEIADKVIDRIVHETKDKIGKPHRILCVRNERKQVSESQFPLLRARALNNYPDLDWQFNRAQGNEKISLDENEILFAGLDDVEKLKSIFDITSIWIEEADQTGYDDFRELDRRLRGYVGDMQIYLSFNPIAITSWLNDRFFKLKDKRSICICGAQPFEDFTHYQKFSVKDLNKTITIKDERTGKDIKEHYYHTVIVHSTYLDNKFIDAAYYRQMAELKRIDPNEYNIYALGMWGIVGGGFFDNEQVTKRKLEMERWLSENDLERGYFEFDYVNHQIIDATIKWVPDKEGYVTIYEQPKKNTPYVIGVDTAGDGSDYNTAICTDNVTKTDVASIKVQLDEDLHIRQVYCLGKWYGQLNDCSTNALIGVEVNFSTHPIKELVRMDYDTLYIREQRDDAFSSSTVSKFGFKTTQSTRKHALDLLRTIVREEPDKIRDFTLIDEMLTFVKNEKGKPEAMKGTHDDMVMARAINCYIAGQQHDSEVEAFENVDMSKLPEDYLEDYDRASEQQKNYILHHWRTEGIV